MKRITFIAILLAGSVLTSCEKPVIGSGNQPAAPDPIEVLQDQVAAERQLRQDAVALAEQEAASKELWQLLTLSLAVITLVAFFGGTAIGSRGKRHADTTEP